MRTNPFARGGAMVIASASTLTMVVASPRSAPGAVILRPARSDVNVLHTLRKAVIGSFSLAYKLQDFIPTPHLSLNPFPTGKGLSPLPAGRGRG